MIRTLTVVAPTTITPAMLVSTDVAEADHAAYNGATTYAEGDRCIVVATHSIYQSLIGSNTGNDPTATPTVPKWAYAGPTNRWKLFDTSISSQTAQATSMSYRLQVGRAVSHLSAINFIGATSIRVRVDDPVYGVVYDKTVSLSSVPVGMGWWAWTFGTRTTPTQAIFSDLPSFPTADILIDIEGGASLAVGVLLLGQPRTFSLGVKAGARVGIQDYSRKERSDYGDVLVVERAFSKRADFEMLLAASEVDSLLSFLAGVRATPCLWIGSERYESTTIYGFYKSFDIVISYVDYSDCSLELEGLT